MTARSSASAGRLLALFLLCSLPLLSLAGGASAATNTAPVARDDSYAVDEDRLLSVGRSAGVLADDSDRQGDRLVARLYRAPYHGTVRLATDGSFYYDSARDYRGTDSFSYRACEAESPRLCSTVARVQISVRSVNDAPVAVADSLNASEDNALNLSAPGVLANDTDVDGQALAVAGASATSGPSHGTLELSPDGSLVYTPDRNFNGTDSFAYKATDGTLTDEATVTIEVHGSNDAPRAVSDLFYARENTAKTVSAPGVLKNDADADGDPLSVVGYSQPRYGQVRVGSGGYLRFVPDKDFTGYTYFHYSVADGRGGQDSGIVTMRVLR